MKEHTSVDAEHGFVLATILSPASVHDTNYFTYCTLYSRHTKHKLAIVYADKGYAGEPNRYFLSINEFKDGIMRKDSKTAKLTKYEINRNKKISKVRYIVEQYFGLSHLHDRGKRARFTTIAKNNIDIWFRQPPIGARIWLANGREWRRLEMLICPQRRSSRKQQPRRWTPKFR